MDNLVALTEAALKLVAEAQDLATLDNVRVDYLGKKGSVSALMKNLGQLSPEERPAAGAEINQAKDKIQDAIAARKADLEDAQIAAKLASEIVDVTLPGRGEITGGLHPVTRTLQRIEEIFTAVGYSARTRHRFRCVPWKTRSRPFALFVRDAFTVAIPI